MIHFQARKELHTSDGPKRLEVDLRVEDGEFVTLFGESGAGKTTILRILAGLTLPESGRIEVDGSVWLDTAKKINVPVQARSIGLVFQSYNLFPNMTVRENVRFALIDPKEDNFIEELLHMVQLTELADRKPAALSAGQQQRVALVRALARRPRILLLDEPLSALDAAMREKLQDDILEIYRKFKITTIFVSHDVSEVSKMSRRMLLIKDGRIIKEGSPTEIFSPANPSGKFKFAGEIIAIEDDGIVAVVTVLVGNNPTKVVATQAERAVLRVGDKVVVASKAFNPILLKAV